ncbi:hypothetical protein [Thalassomonas sp. RHCl1]|uniref:hypothetical protein n=1 Tax=Thalassomonas sp. RHCl1 TaxID=2995320 RepID=UPI00248C63FA|nr:hypothetical protein [Thalassomonas sp. RHCl1]
MTEESTLTSETTKPNNTKNSASKKQAVVVIHGMGEQRPMATIREFVHHVWKIDPAIEKQHFWNKPSSVSESFEQRRLTTNSPKIKTKNKKVQRVDFYEYYWAHHTVNTKWEHFIGWFTTLLWCPRSKYERHENTLRRLWLVLWGGVLAALLSVVIWSCGVEYIATNCEGLTATLLKALISGVELAVLFGLNKLKCFATKYFGDVARYVKAQPANIHIRQQIRQGGIELLERIHQTGDYERIVLVGHSLGSIIAYDIINHLWARHNKFKYTKGSKTHTSPLSQKSQELIEALEGLSKDCGTDEFDKESYREKQFALFNSLKESGKNNWLISDFITLGSPLTYADILLFDSNKEFIKRKLDREYPTSPPIPENKYWTYQVNDQKYLHHGAVFAPVRWTNIYMTYECLIKGDLISGPVSSNFSYSELNIDKSTLSPPKNNEHTPIKEIKISYEYVKDGFTHTEYWKSTIADDKHLKALRSALQLY